MRLGQLLGNVTGGLGHRLTNDAAENALCEPVSLHKLTGTLRNERGMLVDETASSPPAAWCQAVLDVATGDTQTTERIMTTITADETGTDVRTDGEERLFVAHLCRGVRAPQYIERVRGEPERENERECIIYSFGCDSHLRALDAPWNYTTYRFSAPEGGRWMSRSNGSIQREGEPP